MSGYLGVVTRNCRRGAGVFGTATHACKFCQVPRRDLRVWSSGVFHLATLKAYSEIGELMRFGSREGLSAVVRSIVIRQIIILNPTSSLNPDRD